MLDGQVGVKGVLALYQLSYPHHIGQGVGLEPTTSRSVVDNPQQAARPAMSVLA